MRVGFVFAITLLGAVAAEAQATLIGQLTWPSDDRAIGGLSGFDLAMDGRSFVAVNDRGVLLTGRIERAANGAPLNVVDVTKGPLKALEGAGVRGLDIDSEGVALMPDGQFAVSFELKHRVWRYADTTAIPQALPSYPLFDGLQVNSSLEALAVDSDGVLYTMPERSGDIERAFPVFRYRAGNWDQPFDIPRRGPFLLVGADVGPSGRLYILERDFSFIFGFTSRVRSFAIDADSITDERVHLETERGDHDNLEGIAVWQNALGQVHLTMVSDNNFSPLQVTEIVEYRLDTPLDGSPITR